VRTADIFQDTPEHVKPRKKRELLMHVSDAGDGGCMGIPEIVEYTCSRCGHCSGWVKLETITKSKRGIPCPQCNKQEAGDG
jgi:DNA-directed RNA polymerase subunit RPC12/RpoP